MAFGFCRRESASQNQAAFCKAGVRSSCAVSLSESELDKGHGILPGMCSSFTESSERFKATTRTALPKTLLLGVC